VAGSTVNQDAQYALLLESIAEIQARLRVLDEANARLEAAAERQLELLEALVARQDQILRLLREKLVNVPVESLQDETQESQPARSQNGSEPEIDSPMVDEDAGRIIDSGHEYSRETHLALFKVVDFLERDEQARTLSVRQIAQEIGVSKSWCAIARRHVLRGEGIH